MQQIISDSTISMHDLKKLILESVKSKKQGITHEDLMQNIPFQRDQVVQALNNLLENSKIEVMKDQFTKQTFFIYVS